MLKNYFIIAVRNLLRHRTFSLLTILGLAVGMAACFILIQYALFEQSYDDFHKNKNNIYRLGLSLFNEGKLQAEVPKNFSALGPALKDDFPEVTDYVRLFPIDGTMAIRRDNIVFNEKNILFADASFFRVFSFPVMQGISQDALTEPYSVVITRTIAQKYFKDQEPIGKQLMILEGAIQIPLTVKAVVNDVPENSHFTFDLLVSHSTLRAIWGERADNSWDEALFYTYILLDPSANQQTFSDKLSPALLRKYANWEPPIVLDFVIQPLEDIYLYSNMVQEAKVNGNGGRVTFLWIVAALIVSLAWINYINLSTARHMERAKEVGIRKIVGAKRAQLVQQFVLESLVLNVLSIILAIVIVQSVLPGLNLLTGKTIPVWSHLDASIAILVVFILGSLLSAFFPSLILSSLKAVSVLKGKFTSSLKGLTLRKGLVTFQFATSVALLGGTLIVFLQLEYMRSADLGMDVNHTVVLPVPDIIDEDFRANAEYFKNELAEHKEIEYVVSSTSIPGKLDNIIQGGLSRFERSDEIGYNHYNFGVDRNFIDAYSIKILAGRSFATVGDSQSVVINETAMHTLGFAKPEDAIGQRVSANWANERTIIAVVQDFHQRSLQSPVEPIVFSLDDSGDRGYYSVKLDLSSSGKPLTEVISLIGDQWKAAFPGNPFDYFFLDDHFNEQYKDDLRFGRVLNVFSGLTLFIACLGIFGLSTFSTAQRTKEIGVRKVLGASVSSILLLLSRDYLKLIVIALLLALPVTYHFIEQWLHGYVYRISIQWWMLIIPGIVVLAVAVLAISSQSIKAALSNPTESLKG